MRIKHEVLDEIRGNTRTKNLLALALDRSVWTIERLIDSNEENSDLTKAAALKVIRQQTGLTDKKILEECLGEKVS